MRLLHVSDTHLGYAAYGRVNERGLNQREEDVFRAFARVVDAALELSPDVVLHSGDLFDSVRPTNRAVTFAVEQILRLSQKGIPFVVISGNHETPKLRETGSVFRFLEFFPNVHPVYKGAYERLDVGDLAIHCVPHCANQDELLAELSFAKPDGRRTNVLAAHAGVLGVEAFKMGEFNEQILPASALSPAFDYVALGHYHGNAQVADNAWYAGSTERTSFAEAGQEKGYNLVDFESETVAFHKIPARPMVDLAPIDCAGLGDAEVQSRIVEAVEGCDPAGKIVRLRVRNLPSHVHAALDFARIRRAAASALHFQAHYERTHEAAGGDPQAAPIGPLAEEFDRFVAAVPLAGLERERILARAKAALAGVSP
ncbi:MAG TPA: exonuclease SbcCD subunit D [Candidatus Thermoplasmatota archaeon]|nr:exonuclease SbcCD subunit D [Candidatus Thermoplasmatota archaeon]